MKGVRVGDIAEQLRGVTFAKGDASATPVAGSVPVLTAGNIQNGQLVLDGLTYVPAAMIRDQQRVRKDDVLICASSGSLSVVGKAARSRGDFDGGFGAFLKVLRPGPAVDPGYFSHFFQTPAYRRRVSSMAAGANINNLKKEHLDDLEIPLPSLNEQRRIAAILDHADVLRAKRREVLAYLDALTQSIFHDMFGEVRERVRFSSLVGEFRYGTSMKAGKSGCPTLRIPNVIGGILNTDEIKTVDVTKSEFDRLRLREGDLLFVRSNGNPNNVGRCAVFDAATVHELGWPVDRWIFASYLIRARLTKNQHPTYIAAYLASRTGRRHLRERSKTSAGQYNINIDGLGSVEVPAAPPLLQNEFARRVDAVNTQRRAELVAQAVDNELFASLQGRAFRGDL